MKKSKSVRPKNKYRSKFEKNFAEAIHNKIRMKFEPEALPYVIPRIYVPDFVYNKKLYVECKGFFREGDVQKYKAVRDMFIEEGKDFIFLLADPNKKVRKGSKLTMGNWCRKERIPFFTLDTIPELIDYATAGE
tara:strand:- start:9606 stop:10007 length:402 start_codon:yes stop_codon:yes gene_type:complete